MYRIYVIYFMGISNFGQKWVKKEGWEGEKQMNRMKFLNQMKIDKRERGERRREGERKEGRQPHWGSNTINQDINNEKEKRRKKRIPLPLINNLLFFQKKIIKIKIKVWIIYAPKFPWFTYLLDKIRYICVYMISSSVHLSSFPAWEGKKKEEKKI